MRLVYVLATLAAAVIPGCLSSADLSCDCRLWHLRHTSINLRCSRGQAGASGINCQKAQVLDIPRGYQYIPGYALLKVYSLFKRWAEAKEDCEKEGAILALPRDSLAYDGIKQILRSSLAAGGVWFANIGVSDQLNEGVYMGVDGRIVTYLPWMPGAPDNYGNNEDCVDVNSDGLLNDSPCTNNGPYICERRLSVAIPDGYKWETDAGRFYKVHPEKQVHSEAARVCRSENATLLVLDTWQRAEVLVKLFHAGPNSYQMYHTGFTDEAIEGDFVTETGRHLRDMEFHTWERGQPNNNDNGKPENCLVLLERGYYNDARCDLELPFVCEILPV